MLVYTTKGLVERDLLTVKDIVTEGPNDRSTATEWYMGDELVRRDAHVNLFAPPAMSAEPGVING
jgi:hypothetical protein